MKRILSLVLVLALVLGTIPAGFAATATAGETLKGYGLLAGDQNGKLNEDKTITRAEMMVVLAQLLGKFTEAKAYSIPSTSKDVKAGTWYAPYVAFAEKEAWTAGKGNGMFDPNGKVTTQETAAFMMKALGYTVTDFSKVVEEATAKGLLKDVTGSATTPILRGSLFTAALNTLNTAMKDSTVTLGTKLGVIKSTVAAFKMTAAAAVAHNVVEVTLDAAATATDVKLFSVVDKDAKVIEVKAATLISSKKVWLDTADLTAGTIYTVKSGDVSLKFTAIQKDASLPALDKATSAVLDNITVKLVFDKKLDPRKALVATNYTIDNKLTVASAAFAKDADGADVRTTVLLTTSPQTANQIYKVTVGAGITDFFGNKVKSDDSANVLSFGGIKADVTAPKLSSATAINAVKVVLNFTDDSDLSKDTATNIANYTIKNTTAADKVITVTEAKLVKSGDKYVVVELKTTPQVTSNKYEITVANVTDKFGNAINSTATKATFYGQAPDTSAPSVKVATAASNTLVKVVFTETLDATTAETAANYSFNKSLTVVKAVVDADTDSIVWLTTSAQKGAEVYELTVTNVKDEYNNAISSSKVSFAGIALNETAPTVSAAYAKVETAGTFVYVTFDMNMNAATTKVASNYYFGDAIGYGISAEKKDDNVYKIKVNALTENKLYTVTVSNATSIDDILIKDTKNTAQFVGVTTADTDKPSVTTAVALDARTLKVAFGKAMTNGTVTSNANIDYLVAGVSSYVVENVTSSSATAVSLPVIKTIVVGDDENEVTIRFISNTFTSGQLYKVTAAATLTAKNNTALFMDPDKKTATFGGTATSVTVPKIVGVYSINKSTVDIKFNVPVAIKTGTSTALLTFTPESSANVLTTANSTNTTVLSTDKYTLRVATSAELTGGAKYTLDANALTNVIVDLYNDQTVDSTSAKVDFYANSSTNDKPSISSVGTNNGSSLIVNMSEDVTIVDATKVTVNNVQATRVQYQDKTVSKSVLLVYYNNSGLTVGSVKELKFAAGAVQDLVGALNEETKTNFAVSSNERTAPKITDIVVVKGSVGYNKVRVVFNTTVNYIQLSDFTVTSGSASVSPSAIQLTDASVVTNDGISFYSIVDLVFATDLTAKSTVAVSFNGTGSTGKDGMAAELTSSDTAVVPE